MRPTRHIGEWKCPYVCGQALVNSVTTVLFALDMLRKRLLKENNPVALYFISLSRKKQRQAPSLLQNSLKNTGCLPPRLSREIQLYKPKQQLFKVMHW